MTEEKHTPPLTAEHQLDNNSDAVYTIRLVLIRIVQLSDLHPGWKMSTGSTHYAWLKQNPISSAHHASNVYDAMREGNVSLQFLRLFEMQAVSVSSHEPKTV